MIAETDYAIETDGLTRRFGDFVAVDGVTVRIPKGHLYGMVDRGRNAATRRRPITGWAAVSVLTCRRRRFRLTVLVHLDRLDRSHADQHQDRRFFFA
jgi:hypothetical protein